MKTNTTATLYKKSIVNRAEVWTSETIISCHWEARKAANVMGSGLLEADSVSVFIPFSAGRYTIHNGDVLVKGIVTDVISPSFTMTDLRAKYDDVIEVHSVDVKDYGSYPLRHVQVSGS